MAGKTAYEEPHASAEAGSKEAVERAHRVNVDGVAAVACRTVTSHCVRFCPSLAAGYHKGPSESTHGAVTDVGDSMYGCCSGEYGLRLLGEIASPPKRAVRKAWRSSAGSPFSSERLPHAWQ